MTHGSGQVLAEDYRERGGKVGVEVFKVSSRVVLGWGGGAETLGWRCLRLVEE